MPSGAPDMTLLKIDPKDALYFSATSTAGSPQRILKLANVHSGCVAFKVKTTAPKSYLVRPSSGTLKKGENTEVAIILQTQGADGGASPNHRFLVQAVAVADNTNLTREQWADYPKEQVQEQRLNVVLTDDPQGEVVKPTLATGASSFSAETRSTESPSDLKVKYDELVQYTLMLEKEKKKLEVDLGNLQSSKSSKVSSGGGVSIPALLAVAFLTFIISYWFQNSR
eukprot:gnl/TRDRNA2_/TRDRNA2_56354_c0_seq1.p1 gnl/TRDRNA2_/TRDRNA2_56354_c0~~gnl/TRDRNA2_/TRDRNA2_56354_c0_seq1.p1  ORF type:complete len:257 (+),score=43.58 gnl/TRDRNA2_/TRDRNA2_56354_c0_seq1:95-772(+)